MVYSLLRIATNEIGSFCIDDMLRQTTFLVFAKMGKMPAFSEDFSNDKVISVVGCFVIIATERA